MTTKIIGNLEIPYDLPAIAISTSFGASALPSDPSRSESLAL